MQAFTLVLLLGITFASELPVSPSSFPCNPGYSWTNLGPKRACIYCSCRSPAKVCKRAELTPCLARDDLIKRRRNKTEVKTIDNFARDAARTKKQIDEASPVGANQREIFTNNPKEKVINSRKLNNPNQLYDDQKYNPTNDDVYFEDGINNENYRYLKKLDGKESGHFLEERQTLALIRNSKSRVIQTSNTMSVNSKPRFARSHKKENGIKLNINQKRTSYMKDLTKKFKKQNRFRNKRHVEYNVTDSSFSPATTEKIIETTKYTEVFDTTTTPEVDAVTTAKMYIYTPVSTTITEETTPIYYTRKSTEDSNQNNFHATEEKGTVIETETYKQLYDVTENFVKISKNIYELADISEANDIKFKDWNTFDKVENGTKMFHWSKGEVTDLSPKDRILLRKFKKIFRKKSNVIRTKPFTVDKTDRVYLTNTPDVDTNTTSDTIQTKIEVFKNITYLQNLLKEILKRLKGVHADNMKVKVKTKNSGSLSKIDSDILWKLKEHERKAKKQSSFLRGYKNIGVCELNLHRKNIIETRVRELHNITKNIFESIDLLKNDQVNNYTQGRIIIQSSTDTVLASIGKFINLLNEIINTATCKRNNKLQRILRHIGRRHSNNSKITDAVSKMKQLIGKYSTVQNTFVSKMYEAINNFDDTTVKTKHLESVKTEPSKIKSKSEMDAIASKVTKNLKRLKDLVQTLSRSGRAKRDTSVDDTMEMLLLVEYILKQKLSARRQPVEDGIDALIEAIRKAPDVKTVKNQILGLNTTAGSNTSFLNNIIKKTKVAKVNSKSSTDLNDDTNFVETNNISPVKERDTREAISDISLEENSNSRLEEKQSVPESHFSNEETERLEVEDFDSVYEEDNIRPMHVVDNNLEETATTIYVTESISASNSFETLESEVDKPVAEKNIIEEVEKITPSVDTSETYISEIVDGENLFMETTSNDFPTKPPENLKPYNENLK